MKLHALAGGLLLVGITVGAAAHAADATPPVGVYVNQRVNVRVVSPVSAPPPHAGIVVAVLAPSPAAVPPVNVTAWSPDGAPEYWPGLVACTTGPAPCWVLPDGP